MREQVHSEQNVIYCTMVLHYNNNILWSSVIREKSCAEIRPNNKSWCEYDWIAIIKTLIIGTTITNNKLQNR